MKRLGLLLVSCAFLATCTGSAKPSSRAERIGALADTIGGPHAIGQIGDFLLENDQIRLIISDTGVNADPAKTTLGRVNTTYGGSLVDADLRRVNADRAGGNDQLAELLPGMVFTVIDPTNVCIPRRDTGECPMPGQDVPLRDGSDGGAAEIKVIGTGGDLLQMVALLNTGLMFPSNLGLSTVYRLHPGKRYVEIETTIKNTSTGAHPFPFLQPQEIKDLGFDVPGLENLQLSVPMGMLPLFGGEQDFFTPGFAGFNVQYAIEATYLDVGGFPAFPGMVADFVATRGEGVSYGLAVPRSPNNFVNKYRMVPDLVNGGMKPGYPNQDVTEFSMLLPFTYAGVAGVYMYDPPPQLGAGEEFSYTAFFVVGDGDVASVADTIFELREQPTGQFGGRVIDEQTSAPIARASVFILDAQGRPINQIKTDENGSFQAKLLAGSYTFVVQRDDRLTTAAQPLTITANEKQGVLVQMKPPATLIVSTLDELGRKAPSKIQLIGQFDPANANRDPRTFLYDLRFGERKRPTAFDGSTRFVEGAWSTKDGSVSATVRPGTYELVASRGPEYEVTRKMITLEPGAFVADQLDLVRSFDTPGWIGGDFHLHAAPSTDSGLPIDERVISCAAEGLEVAVATDHNYITDYAPVIASSGLDPWLLGIPGVELTTFEMGHFNAYPLKIDPGSTRGGEFRWANQPPQKLFDTLRGLAVDPANAIVQVNHPRQQVLGYFSQFFVDSLTAEPYQPTGILGVFAPYGDEFKAVNYSSDFDAIELLTGRRSEDIHTFRAPNPLPPGPFPNPQPVPGEIVVQADGRPQFPGVVETWFTMLDRGHRATGMGTSDTHKVLGHEPGYARTLLFVGAGKDTPGGYSRDDVVNAIKQHRAITTNAPFIDMRIGDKTIGDDVSGANHRVTINVRSPSWAPVNKLIIYSNSVIVREFDIPAAQGTDFSAEIDFAPAQDAWLVAEVTGTSNMFPVLSPTEFPPLDATIIIQSLAAGLDLSTLPLTARLKPQRTHTSTPYAITNPIWVDVNGGGFTPPRALLPRVAPAAPTKLPDVRSQFDSLPEISR